MDDLEDAARRFIVMIRRTRTGYSADVPDLPGCVSTGMTVEHTRHMIAEATAFHLEGMQQHGEPIPAPRQSIDFTIDEEDGEVYCTWVEVDVDQPVSS
jgi:predicted RNase H-like HicB family nuclease